MEASKTRLLPIILTTHHHRGLLPLTPPAHPCGSKWAGDHRRPRRFHCVDAAACASIKPVANERRTGTTEGSNGVHPAQLQQRALPTFVIFWRRGHQYHCKRYSLALSQAPVFCSPADRTHQMPEITRMVHKLKVTHLMGNEVVHDGLRSHHDLPVKLNHPLDEQWPPLGFWFS